MKSTNLNKLKEILTDFQKKHPEYKKNVKSRFKKGIVWSFVSMIGISLIFFGFFLYFYLNWQTDRSQVLKQAEIYYNQILKETQVYTRYKNIGGKDYHLQNVDEPIKVLDFRGEVLGEFSNERRSFVSLEEVSPYFLYALLSTEDSEYFSHSGINYKALIRAMIKNIISLRVVEGGSTLTQQLSKILFTNRERTLKRKIYEFFCARELEKIYTKEDILLMYVNLIYLGHGAYGIEYASRLYFNKPASQLTLGESALLVSVISNPARYSPFLNRKNSVLKHKAVLGRMETVGYIRGKTAASVSEKFWKKNQFNKKDLNRGKSVIRNNEAPYIMEEVRRFVTEKFGEDFFIKNKGGRVYTTIDKRLQDYSAKMLKNHLKYLRRIASAKLSKTERENIQGAVLFTVPQSGEIRVLLGGEEFGVKNQLNRAFQAKRQIGSTMKPFLYLSGIEKEVITPYTVFEDKPITIEIENAPEDQRYWEVNNYNDKYKGYLTATEALYRSANVVAAQVAYMIGVEDLQHILTKILGLSLEEGQKRFPSYQYSLSLGAAEMTPLEVNRLFITLANQGEAVEPHLISKITDSRSRAIYEAPTINRVRIVSKEAAYLVLSMMKRVLEPGGTAGWLRKTYGLNIDLAGKTGTTQDSRDAWFNGINPSMAGTVWIGQDDNLSMGKKFTGGGAAAPIWALIMKKAVELYPMGMFNSNSTYNLVRQPVCLLSGKVPTEKCKFVEENAYFISGTEPGEYCDLSEEEMTRRALIKGWTSQEKQEDEEKKPDIEEAAAGE